MNPRDLIRQTAAEFRAAGIPDPGFDSALLLSSLCGRPPLDLRLDEETVLDAELLERFDRLKRERLKRIPLQYLLREAPFCGLMFMVDSRVLIPRPETELLCLWAQEALQGAIAPRILDLCCGSGCIGLTLKSVLPNAQVTLSDLSADALAVAEENSRRLCLEVVLRKGDLLEGLLPASFDLIVSNPPYIPAQACDALQPEVLFEPRMALDGGADGLDFYRRIAQQAKKALCSGGILLMELGIGEAPHVAKLLSEAGYTDIQIRSDLNGIERMIHAARTDGVNQ